MVSEMEGPWQDKSWENHTRDDVHGKAAGY